MFAKLYHRYQDFISYFGPDVLGKLLFFSIPVFYAVISSPEDFGRYSLIMTIVYFFTGLAFHPLQIPTIVAANQSKTPTRILSASLLWYGLSAFVCWQLMNWWHLDLIKFTHLLPKQLVFIQLAMIGVGLEILITASLMGLNQKNLVGLFSFYSGVFAWLFLALLHATNYLSPHTLVLIFLFPRILALSLIIKKIAWIKFFPLSWSAATLKQLLLQSRWFFFGAWALYVINWGDNMILSRFVELAEIGHYNFAYHLFKGYGLLISSVILYFTPSIAKQITNKDYLQTYLTKKRVKLVLGWCGTVLLLGLVLTLGINLLATAYTSSLGILWILHLAAILLLIRRTWDPVINAHQRFDLIQHGNILLAGVNFGLSFLLIPFWGSWGAALATLIGYVIATAYVEFQSNRLQLDKSL